MNIHSIMFTVSIYFSLVCFMNQIKVTHWPIELNDVTKQSLPQNTTDNNNIYNPVSTDSEKHQGVKSIDSIPFGLKADTRFPPDWKVDTVTHTDQLTKEVFEERYRFKNPLIVNFQNGASEWTNTNLWSWEMLEKRFDTTSVLKGDSMDIVRRGGRGWKPVDLGRYMVDDMELNVDHDTSNPQTSGKGPEYVFDRSFCDNIRLKDEFNLPPYVPTQNTECILFLGPTNSGVSFHKHADAWNLLIKGRKQWFFYPRSFTPPGGVHHGYSHIDWIRYIHPNLPADQQPIQCIQEAGQIMYIPESVYHMTLNLEPSLAVGLQKDEPDTDVGKIIHDYENNPSTKDPDILAQYEEKFTWLHSILPECTEVMSKLASLKERLGKLDSAIALIKKAVKTDPYFVVALLDLAKLFEMNGDIDNAEAILHQAKATAPRLWDVYAMCGDFYMRTKRPKLAIECFSKGVEIEPKMVQFSKRLKEAHDLADFRKTSTTKPVAEGRSHDTYNKI